MEARLQLRVQRSGWDRAAPHYDRSWLSALQPATEIVLDRAGLRPGQRVLDVACGSGVLTVEAWRKVTDSGEVIGSDISESMLAIARERAPACRFVRADAQDLAALLPHGHFDAVLCGMGLMYLPDPETALSSTMRLLRADGRLVASVWGERRACVWADIFGIVDARVQSDVCPMFFRLGGGDTLAAAFRSAGLKDVDFCRVPATLHYPSAQAACDAAFLGGAVALAHAHFDEPTRVAVQAEYLASIEAFRHGSRYSLPSEFVVAWGSAA